MTKRDLNGAHSDRLSASSDAFDQFTRGLHYCFLKRYIGVVGVELVLLDDGEAVGASVDPDFQERDGFRVSQLSVHGLE